MAVQILSDLHLESPKGYDIFEVTPKAPYLALLGDIGNVVPHKDEFFSFLRKQVDQFQIVFFVPGNHEAYHSSWPETLNELTRFAEQTSSNSNAGLFVLLNRRTYRLPSTNVVILGCSLFSRVQPNEAMAVEMGLQDFYQTDDWDIKKHNEAHRQDLTWLNAEVTKLQNSNEDLSLFIFTHWSPSRDARASDPRHASSAITSGFATDLTEEPCFGSEKVKIWAFGHTHYNCDVEVARNKGAEPLRLLSNQRGYYFAQAEGFDAEKTVQVL